MANVVYRFLQCSSARAIRSARKEPRNLRIWGGMTAGMLGQFTDRDVVASEYRLVRVAVDLDRLAPQARSLAERTEFPLNRLRASDYTFDSGLTVRQAAAHAVQAAGQPTAVERAQAAVSPESLDRPFRVVMPWPCMLDWESGEGYYQRAALLLEVYRELIQAGHSLEHCSRWLSQLRRWSRPWTREDALRYVADLTATRSAR